MDNGTISFNYKDRKDKNKTKVMSLTSDEFIRRFLLHILPSGYIKIRHYGLLSNATRKNKVNLIRRLIGISPFFKKLLAHAKGKKQHDKRETEKTRDWQREKQRLTRHR